MMNGIRTYSELMALSTFEERFKYLQLGGSVGVETFGYDRIFNQRFYRSKEWKDARRYVIARDMGCDLGCYDRPIPNGVPIYIHHINPIMLEDIDQRTDILLNPEFLITTTFNTHNAIHYGDEKLLVKGPVERRENDTCPWKH